MITGTFDNEKLELKNPMVNSCLSNNKCGEVISFLRQRICLFNTCTMTTLWKVYFAF